ncbi:hypothetical protein BKA66DRAFT_404477 [Pyrenochaeta sp. MPI-SDFR-AT-0127]|nr:hypothetical protein BKA66DRAFT_404477 [Pyrenochaeta sp. MPI-SDFR-AT-0127]
MDSPRQGTLGALLTTPISVTTLDVGDRKCPLCHELYVEPVHQNKSNDTEKEWPVSITIAAQWSGLKRCCGHIFGRRCLEKHLQASGAWRNKCPICRDVWFDNTAANEDTTPHEQLQAETHYQARVTRPLRRSLRIASRAMVRRRTRGTPLGEDQRYASTGIQRARIVGSDFMQQLLRALEVNNGSDEVNGTLEEVEQKLGALYDGNK